MRVRASLLAVLAALPLVGAAPDDASVSIAGFAYLPQELHVWAGEPITWTNDDGPTHTVTSDAGSALNSGNLASGQSYRAILAKAGTEPYHCAIHPFMTGRVITVAPPSPDLVVVALAFTDPAPLVKRITATVANAGLDAAGPSKLGLAYRYQGQLHGLGEVDVPAVAGGGQANVSLDWNVAGKVGRFPVVGTADVGGDVDEFNEGNNVLERLATVIAPVQGVDLLDPL